MLKYIQDILRNNTKTDLGYYLADLLDYRQLIKYNPTMNRFEIPRQILDYKMLWAFKFQGYYNKKSIEETNIYVQLNEESLAFWIE